VCDVCDVCECDACEAGNVFSGPFCFLLCCCLEQQTWEGNGFDITTNKQTNNNQAINAINLIDEIALDPPPMLQSLPNCDSSVTFDSSFGFHRNFAVENGATENDVEAAKSVGKSDDSTAANAKSAERAMVGCTDDSCFEVNFDGN